MRGPGRRAKKSSPTPLWVHLLPVTALALSACGPPRAGWIRGEVTRNAGGGLHILEIVHHNRYILSNVWGKRWVPNHCQINLKPFLHPRHHPYIYILLYHLHHVVYMMIIVIVCVMYKMMIIMRILLLSLIRLPGYAGTRPPLGLAISPYISKHHHHENLHVQC